MADSRIMAQDRGWLKLALGIWIVALTMLAAAAPWPFALAVLLPPAVAHAAIFDWSLRRHDALPAGAAFGLGLLLDVIGSGVFGLGALTCVVVHYVAAAQRRFLGPRGLIHAWIGAGLMAILVAIVSWTAVSAYSFEAQPVRLILTQTLLTAAAYPILGLFYGAVRSAVGLGERVT